VYLPQGEHVIAIGQGEAAAAERVVLAGRDPHALALAFAPATDNRWDIVRSWVAAWRASDQAPTPYELGQLLTTIGVRTAFVLTKEDTADAAPADQLQAWALPVDSKQAAMVGVASLDRAGSNRCAY
jgi:hypothetical protein